MKGIEAIIAVILLLLITISVVGFAFLFFSRITTAGQAAENQTTEQLIQFSKQIGIDAYNGSQVTIRNTGTSTIGATEISIYVNGAPRVCNPAMSNLVAGSVQTCDYVRGVGASAACGGGQKLRVTSPANSLDVNC